MILDTQEAQKDILSIDTNRIAALGQNDAAVSRFARAAGNRRFGRFFHCARAVSHSKGITNRHDAALIVVSQRHLAFLGAAVCTAVLDRVFLSLALTALTRDRTDRRHRIISSNSTPSGHPGWASSHGLSTSTRHWGAAHDTRGADWVVARRTSASLSPDYIYVKKRKHAEHP